MKIKNIIKSEENREIKFDEIKQWYNENLSPSKIDLNDKKVYENVYHKGRWAGIFQATQKPVQNFFQKAKPENVSDIATLTSIWRPGPLTANVHDLYLKSKIDGEMFDWGDQRINDVLKESYNCMIFQESVMEIANKIAGFPLEECDNVRKAIMKKSSNPTEEDKKKAIDLKNKFIDGCESNNLDKNIASQLYENIQKYASYGFNKSHAISYALNSYLCAWLLNYYESEWLCSYLEYMSTPNDIPIAFSDVKSIGWDFIPVDINFATKEWTILPGKKFMPSFLSCKGIGDSAIDEILANRPYKNIEDFLWDDNNEWKHSKFNKKSLETLIKIKGFDSLNCVGEGKLFSSYKHMYHVLIENYELVKKTSVKEPDIGKINLYKIAKETYGIEEWTPKEFIEIKFNLTGIYNIFEFIPTNILNKLSDNNITCIDDANGDDKEILWFVVKDTQIKKTKNGKNYLLIDAIGLSAKVHKIYVWLNGKNQDINFDKFTLCIAEMTKSDFGFSTNNFKIKKISLNE